LRDFAHEIYPINLVFGGIGSQGVCKEAGRFDFFENGNLLSIEFALTDAMPDGFDCIIGLDSGLNFIDLSNNLAKIGNRSFCFNVTSDGQPEKTGNGVGKLLEKHVNLFTNGELW
jgi:hypothetical protein